jgi:hypothetical protein
VKVTTHLLLVPRSRWRGAYLSTGTTLLLCWYGYKSSSIIKEDPALRVFENRVLRRIFGPKEEKVTQLVLHTKFYQGDQAKEDVMNGEQHVAHMGGLRCECKIVVG